MKTIQEISLVLLIMPCAAIFATAQANAPVTYRQLAGLTPSDGASSDAFGYSVAISGNTVVAGAPAYGTGGAGKAYVYVKPASGWVNATQIAELTPSDGVPGLSFGGSVAISGNTIVIDAGLTGREYVFVEPESGWTNMTETAQLSLPNGDGLGTVTITGNTIIAVGFPPDSSDCALYVFVKPKSGWSSSAKPRARLSASTATNYLGYALAFDGSTVVATTPSSSAYVFVEPVGGWVTATQTATLSLSPETGSDEFGASAAISGGTIAIGAPETGSDQEYYGEAYLYYEPSNGWVNATQSAEIQSPNFQTWGFFGTGISVTGGLVAISANGENVGNNTLVGAVFVFEGASQIAELTPSDDQPSEEMGWSVAGSGSTITASARYANGSNGAPQVGKVYVFGP